MFALLGLFTYLLALIATVPARFLLDDAAKAEIVLTSAGTIWNGEAALREGHGLRWRWAPLDSMFNLAFIANFTVVGPDTYLRGQARWRPGGFGFANVNGNAAGALVSALAPRLPFKCDFLMRVNIRRIIVRGQQQGIEGEIRSSAGTCAARADSRAQAPIPPLRGSSTITPAGSSGFVVTQFDRTPLVTSEIRPDGAVAIRVTPRGAAMLPSAAMLGPLSLETRW